ncbi:MAG: hypothetical protein WA655_18245 [Candidatus Korobacteraceae bacterium]
MARLTTTPEFRNLLWSATEKRVAREVFQRAYGKQCAAIRAKLRKMISQASEPSDIWSIHDFLSEERKRTDEVFDFRYSVLIQVFGTLLREGWLNKHDLAGLSEDKITKIQQIANLR